MSYGITQCYLPPGRCDIPALTPAKAGTRLSVPVCPLKSAPSLGGSGPPTNTWFFGPRESTPQTASRSVHPFLRGATNTRIDTHTHTYAAIRTSNNLQR